MTIPKVRQGNGQYNINSKKCEIEFTISHFFCEQIITMFIINNLLSCKYLKMI